MSGNSNQPASSKHKTTKASSKNNAQPSSKTLTQEQFIDYIQKLIKNNKKHFEKNQANEELY
jgi:hypothetical protein